MAILISKQPDTRRNAAPRSVALAIVMTFVTGAYGQVDEYHVKSAILFNFAKFVEWPTQTFRTPTEPIVICILGQNPFGNALETTVSGKTVSGRSLAIRQNPDGQLSAGCQMLFVASTERKRFRSIVRGFKGAGVLSIGEGEDFAADGGVISLKMEGGKVRFEINVAAAEYADIRISANLLSLAQVVRKPL